MSARTRLVLLHTLDPRGYKLGGIETHVRLVLSRFPETTSLLFVGVDELGDLVPGRCVSLDIDDRRIAFMPVVRIPKDDIDKAATRVFKSTTLLFALGLIRHLPALRKATRGLPASCEIERNEFAIFPKLLGLPLAMLVHNEGTGADKMDSLLKRYWWAHLLNERIALMLADHVFAVNDAIAVRIASLFPRFGRKTEVMSVSVDTDRFVASPFVFADDAFHVCFAGRLDAFKDPPLMFATIKLVADKLSMRDGRFRRVVFDYVGASDPTIIPEFAAIAPLTICHGIRRSSDVAAIMAASHAGIITSFFEGMPCYLLEMFASGRPVAAIRLPQFDPLVIDGLSGRLVPRADTSAGSAEALSDAFIDLAASIERNALDPASIAGLVRPYSVGAQMKRLFARHEALARGDAKPAYPSESARSA